MSMSDRAYKAVKSWVSKHNRKMPKLIDEYVNVLGEVCYVVAMSDNRRPLKITTVRDNMPIRTALSTDFACDGIEPIHNPNGGIPLGYKFHRPYGECSDEYAYKLWLYSNEDTCHDLKDFDFNDLKNMTP